MKSRLFTLEEANRILPLVRSITVEALSAYRRVKAAIAALEALRARGVPGADVGAVQRGAAEGADRRGGLRRRVGELEAVGCRLRDYERGSVDFPAALVGERGFVVFCWALGEPSVTHWHDEDEGFEARRTLSADAA